MWYGSINATNLSISMASRACPIKRKRYRHVCFDYRHVYGVGTMYICSQNCHGPMLADPQVTTEVVNHRSMRLVAVLVPDPLEVIAYPPKLQSSKKQHPTPRHALRCAMHHFHILSAGPHLHPHTLPHRSSRPTPANLPLCIRRSYSLTSPRAPETPTCSCGPREQLDLKPYNRLIRPASRL